MLPLALLLRLPDEQVTIPETLGEFLSRHSPMLLSVGGLEKDYDPLFQIAAMKDILAEFPNAGLMIVGDGSMRSEAEAAVAASGHSENIFLAGNIEHDVTLHLINDCDMLLRTTLYDGDAISVREALFLDTPVIATDNRMRPEGVRLIAFGDNTALVEQVRLAAKTPPAEKRQKASEPENIIEIVRLYETLIEER